MLVLTSCQTPLPSQRFIDDAREQDVLAILPYSLDLSGRMLVDVEVNGMGPYKFIVDSAASRSLLYENLRRKLDIEYIKDETTFVHGAVLNQSRPVLPIEKISVDGLSIENIQSFSLPDPFIADGELPGGILGLDFLNQYALYVNVTNSRIILAKSGYKPRQRKYTSVPIVFDNLGFVEHGVPVIEALIQNVPAKALLDLGATETIINWAAADSVGVNITRALRGRFRYQGIFGDIPVLKGAKGGYIVIGERFWSDQRLDISNLQIFKTMGWDEEPAIIVSAKLLREENFIIDFPAGTFYLEAGRDQRTIKLRRGRGRLDPTNEDILLLTPPTTVGAD